MDLQGYLRRPEGKTLEFKRDLSSPDKVLRTLVAFANTAGGVLLIGVEDAARAIRGVADPLAEEERLANLISDRIAPQMLPEMEILPWRRTHVLCVQVFPGVARPYYLKDLGPERGAFVRVGSTNRLADQAMREEMRRAVRNETFDETVLSDLSSEAIDFRAASECFSSMRQLRQNDLETLRILTSANGTLRPTVGGVLLFGIERERLFPDAWLQAGRFAGADRKDILDQAAYRDPLPLLVDQAVAFIQKHDQKRADLTGIRRRDRWGFPLAAIREAVINAIVHADYSQRGAPIRVAIFDDRLEIENPGLLPFGLTIDDIRRGVSKLRNRVIGRVFAELGLIEQWGSGIGRMTRACEDEGLPPPVFEEIGVHFRVTIRLSPIAASRMDPVNRQILEELEKRDEASTQTLAKAIGRSARATRTRMVALVERGLVVEIGAGPRDPHRKYVLAVSNKRNL